MKKRLGFVSNSSSSSFICDVSGEDYSGMDAGLEDAEMYQCTEGHTFLEQYLEGNIEEAEKQYRLEFTINDMAYDIFGEENKGKSWWSAEDDIRKEYEEKAKVKYNSMSEENKEGLLEETEMYEFRYKIPVENCPICTLNYITDETMVDYMMATLGKTKAQIENEIKEKYNTLKDIK